MITCQLPSCWFGRGKGRCKISVGSNIDHCPMIFEKIYRNKEIPKLLWDERVDTLDTRVEPRSLMVGRRG